MATSITLKDELYSQVVERARCEDDAGGMA
jgi:hypothetical protein